MVNEKCSFSLFDSIVFLHIIIIHTMFEIVVISSDAECGWQRFTQGDGVQSLSHDHGELDDERRQADIFTSRALLEKVRRTPTGTDGLVEGSGSRLLPY